MDKDAFFLRVAHALAGCQLVEQELKLYITEALLLVAKCVDGRLSFRMNGEDYEKDSLGGLIQVFEKLSDNGELVRQLKDFTRKRNTLSHQGITRCLDYEGDISLTDAAKYEQQLLAIEADAERLRIALHNEANKFRGDLYFDPIPDAG